MKQHLQHGRALYVQYSQRNLAFDPRPALPSMFDHLTHPEKSDTANVPSA